MSAAIAPLFWFQSVQNQVIEPLKMSLEENQPLRLPKCIRVFQSLGFQVKTKLAYSWLAVFNYFLWLLINSSVKLFLLFIDFLSKLKHPNASKIAWGYCKIAEAEKRKFRLSFVPLNNQRVVHHCSTESQNYS